MLVNSGYDQVSSGLGGDYLGHTGTSTGVTATSLTDTSAAWATNALTGHVVVTGSVYGVVLSNTSTVLTIDQWYTPGNPGGGAAATPATGVYQVLPGASPVLWMALSANTATPVDTDTTLPGEITTAGGGLVRKVSTYAHTTGASTYTQTATYTANSSDVLPVTIAKMGGFNSAVVSGSRMSFETLLNQTATLNAVGDQVTVTQTVTV
jgi:hypothetical protein